MAKRQTINISKKAYFIAVAAIFIFSIAINYFISNFAPQFAHHLRYVSNAVTITLAITASYRLMSAGYRTWLSYLVPVFFLLVVPFIVVIIALGAGIRPADPRFDLMVLGTVVYTIVFLILVGLLPNKGGADSQPETDRSEPHNRIEPRF